MHPIGIKMQRMVSGIQKGRDRDKSGRRTTAPKNE
jgi:hypothetical protein